jgi:hypothetical protein
MFQPILQISPLSFHALKFFGGALHDESAAADA